MHTPPFPLKYNWLLDVSIYLGELQIDKSARQHDHRTFLLLKTIPGVGQILALTILYEICTIARFPSCQDFCSYSRLIRPEKQSNGKWAGKGNTKIGNAHLKWAIKEAAILFIRESDQVKKYVDKMTRKHDKGKAMGLLTHKLGRTIYYMLKNKEPFKMEKFFAN
jgi:transposase